MNFRWNLRCLNKHSEYLRNQFDLGTKVWWETLRESHPNLLQNQHRQTITKNVAHVVSLLNVIRLEKREKYLRQQKQWDKHKETFIVGGFCLVQKDRRKTAGWKLREIFEQTPYQIVKVFRTYLFLIPLAGCLSLLKSPFVKGNFQLRATCPHVIFQIIYASDNL